MAATLRLVRATLRLVRATLRLVREEAGIQPWRGRFDVTGDGR